MWTAHCCTHCGCRLAIGKRRTRRTISTPRSSIKLRRGYPQDNIIFEDSTQAVLIQSKREVMRCPVDDVSAVEKLLELFFGYERAEIAEFRKAVEQFKTDLPAVLRGAARDDRVSPRDNAEFRQAPSAFCSTHRRPSTRV